MVDDQICVANCRLDSALATAHLNAQTNIKKLQSGANKCHKRVQRVPLYSDIFEEYPKKIALLSRILSVVCSRIGNEIKKYIYSQ